MKYIIILIFVSLSIALFAQNSRPLKSVNPRDGLIEGKAIIYGNFIQRLGFKSGGFHIEPGNYAILNYMWTESKWYGGKNFEEPIFIGVDASSARDEQKGTATIEPKDLERFTFTITENSIHYLGTWHFDTGIASFSDDKNVFDEALMSRFLNLDFSAAKTTLPK